ncbi:hypothetical protein B6D52_03030 [Candidatus Parcubacteria bacterium 4484_255]|nr:MAG: hypothetical protein B6D52_03030 [Candidatus Parcubacteria bacterium 4484_255]
MLELKASVREIKGRKTKDLRKRNIIPAVVYGHELESLSIQVLLSDFEKVLKQTGESSLINLKIEGQNNKKVLIHAIQYHPLTNEVNHIDFYQIKEGEKIIVEIGLKFVGTSRAVKDFNGVLIHELDKIEAECLPKDLIGSIEVDLSKLAKLNDVIRISDLEIPENIKILSDVESSVVSVKAPKIMEEEEKEEKKEGEEEEVPISDSEGEKEDGQKKEQNYSASTEK